MIREDPVRFYFVNMFLLEHIEAKTLQSNAFITGPCRYRKVEET